jgi:hypothetical protein
MSEFEVTNRRFLGGSAAAGGFAGAGPVARAAETGRDTTPLATPEMIDEVTR